jgi:single stranded DNA-binding protein (ssb)
MASVNKVILIGHLGADPEISTTQGGTALAKFRIATTDTWKDRTKIGRAERTEWHSIVAWDKLAQICGDYLHKGKMVYVEGRLQTRSWDDESGQKRYKTEIKANNILMLSPRTDGAARENLPAVTPAGTPDEDDDVPF